jgi:hypothetical protein
LKIKNDKVDIIAVETNFDRIVGLYRGFKLPPGATRVSFFDSIICQLKLLSKTCKKLTIGGDFNVDLFKPSSNLSDLDNWSLDAGLDQLVRENTRQRLVHVSGGETRVESSAIDHVYTNAKNWKLKIIESVSDHSILLLEKEDQDPIPKRQKVVIRDWRNYSKEAANMMMNDKLQKISTTTKLSKIQEIYKETLDELAPLRVIQVTEGQLISPKIEVLKKRTDRYLKKYRKNRNPKHLELAKSFTNTIKKTVKAEAKRVFQCKAKSKNPKHFWQALGDKLGKHHSPVLFLTIDNTRIDNQVDLANIFADFFLDKVKNLSNDSISLQMPKTSPLQFSYEEVQSACKSLNNKRSFGTAGIPQNLIKDTFETVSVTLVDVINSFGRDGLPESVKTARVTPLHKKGSKNDVVNYRPISNLSVFSKVYEKCILSRLIAETSGLEGENQHGFRKHHSTETALLMIQSKILDSGDPGIIYSFDLSAAFNLLRPDKFFELFKGKISDSLLGAIMDFLTGQKFKVELGDFSSETKELDRGCVQGSILGPRLFSLYVGGLANHLRQAGGNIDVI